MTHRTAPAHVAHERPYSRVEVISDGVLHAVALIGALIGGVALVWQTATGRGVTEVSAVSIYAVALVTMLGCSLAYNMAPASPRKWLLRRFDLSGIYLMIAGTYTPLLTQVADPFTAWSLAAIVWGGAIAGIVAALGFPGRADRLNVLVYLALGWVAVFALKPLSASLSVTALALVGAGGLLYTLGVVFFRWNSLKFQNVIWHGFVVAAAACHYAAITAAMA
jgi:hemolysin III